MRCHRCKQVLKRGTLAAQTRHGHVMHAECYHAPPRQVHRRIPRPPLPTRPVPAPRFIRSQHYSPQTYQYAPRATQPPSNFNMEMNDSKRPATVDTDLELSSFNDSEQSDKVSSVITDIDVPSIVESDPGIPDGSLRGGAGVTPYNLNLEGGGHLPQHPAEKKDKSFEIDIFMDQ